MEPKISRSRAKAAMRLQWISIAALLVSVLTVKWYIMLIAIVFTFFVAQNADEVCTCPHCGEHFRGLNVSKPDAGYCRKCGKLMEFDEESEE